MMNGFLNPYLPETVKNMASSMTAMASVASKARTIVIRQIRVMSYIPARSTRSSPRM
jgi:hypothetical protein